MKHILSTVNLRPHMIEEIEEKYPEMEYRFTKSSEMTDEDRGWCEIFITYGGNINEEDVGKFKNLKWMMVMSAGLDDLPLAQLTHVHITNAKGIHKIQMTEYTVGLLLSFHKNFNQLKADQDNAYWRKNAKTEEIHGKSVHVLGTGSIGSHLAKVLRVFGTEVVGYNTTGHAVEEFDHTHPMDELAQHINEADIIINILPSTEETRGMLETDLFEKMKESAVFVNIGRGDIMTDETISEVLEQGMIRHMILDVFNHEPLPADHVFYTYDNMTITPHASSKTEGYLERGFGIFAYNLQHMDNLQSMKNVIDNSRGY
ncbi:D-2-hydroxyacid dehydrogenase [Salinicoccus hispanicus]|uniref:D-2-hydroxyacid dehydrogenase n=1 Tax=Salinicoccus hispanicus TaxID=157225 RepID=A0A6N8U3I6_9STAP|nr:D-2-hydroxyacid dehydrogenase [Salinicoccus hispanicus]MXQ51877.1 D-2-hydroxyacid dehydrogenase [Salinicoccus hispanicus]